MGSSLQILDDGHGVKVEAINLTLAKTIWKGHHPKKVKFFLWEIVHKAIGTSKYLKKGLTLLFLLIGVHCARKEMNHKATYLCNLHTLRIFGQQFSIYSDDISHFLKR